MWLGQQQPFPPGKYNRMNESFVEWINGGLMQAQ